MRGGRRRHCDIAVTVIVVGGSGFRYFDDVPAISADFTSHKGAE
jgi:hypothetical protein